MELELIDWLHKEKVTMSAMGVDIGRAQSIISRICNRKHEPDPETARRIVVRTKGVVSMDVLYSVPKRYRCGGCRARR